MSLPVSDSHYKKTAPVFTLHITLSPQPGPLGVTNYDTFGTDHLWYELSFFKDCFSSRLQVKLHIMLIVCNQQQSQQTKITKQYEMNIWKNSILRQNQLCTTEHPPLIVLTPTDYCLPFNTNKTNTLRVDDNLNSWKKKKRVTQLLTVRLTKPKQCDRKDLTCYDCCHYTTQSDTQTDINTAGKTYINR